MPTLGPSGNATMGSTKLRDTMADKSGPHHTVYWAKKNPKFSESKRLGLNKSKHSEYTSGQTYSGEWNNNSKHGFGVLVKGDGSKYEGYWKNNKQHGTGTLWLRRDKKLFKRYTGAWVKGNFHGTGIYFYDNGDKYEGEWHNNKRQGRGTLEYANGDIYEGDWDDDMLSGIGVLLYAKGDRFEGSFHRGVKEGPGRHFYMSTKKMYEGEWHSDTAKCGVYSELPPAFAREQPEPAAYTIQLPKLALTNPERVLDGAVEVVENKRLSGPSKIDGYATQAPEEGEKQGLNKEQTVQLRVLFDEFDAAGVGYLDVDELKRALRRLGLSAPTDQVDAFLGQLGINALSDVEWKQFLNVVELMLC